MEVDAYLPTDIFDDETRGKVATDFLSFNEDLFPPPSVCSSDDLSTSDDLLNCILNSPEGSESSADSVLRYDDFNSSDSFLSCPVINSPAGSESSADSLLSPSTFDLEDLTLSVTDSTIQLNNSGANFPMDFDWASALNVTDLSTLNENMITTIGTESLPGLSVTPAVMTSSTPQLPEQTPKQMTSAITLAPTSVPSQATTTQPTFMIVRTSIAKPTLSVAPTKTIFVSTPQVKTTTAVRTTSTSVAEPTKGALLELSSEEQRLLKEEGAQLPTDVPLTKAEQKTLKKIRRKIKNKQSAQESRRKKKEYIDGLERRVKICTEQNNDLQKKVENLEVSNRTLLDELKRLQTLVASTNPTKAQAGTCLMVVVLAFALVLAPLTNNFGSSDKTVPTVQSAYAPVSVRSRTLLQISEDVESNQFDGGNNVPNVSDYLKGLTFSLGLTKGGIADPKSANFVESHVESTGDYSHLERKDSYSRLEYV